MKILCLAKAYNSYGASILTFAAQHLELYLTNIDPLDLRIEVVAFIAHDGSAKPTLEILLEQHKMRFPEQVRARHRAKAGKLDIEYPSALKERESFGNPGGVYAVAHVLPQALLELSEAVVEGLRSKPAIWNKINVSKLAEAIAGSHASMPADPDQILGYMRSLDDARRASVKAAASVDDLDIDWRRYHPDARRILDQPLFWSEIDDDAPHGNDTGSDLLAAFSRWNKRDPARSYEGYVDRLLSRWGVTPAKAGGQLDEAQLDRIRQEADIAMAFAALKFRGSCNEPEAHAAILALDDRIKQLGDFPVRIRHLRLLREKLQVYSALT